MSNSNESPVSTTYSLVSPSGFNVLFTVRGDVPTEMLMQMEKLDKTLVTMGYKPQEKRGFGPSKPPAEIVPGRKCPLCQNNLVYSTTKDGKKMIKCSTNKWNFTTKQSEGCKFVEWLDDVKPVAPTPVNTPTTPHQVSLNEQIVCGECGGPTTMKEGISKFGKPYRAFFCANDRSHKPIFKNVEVEQPKPAEEEYPIPDDVGMPF